MTTLVLGGAGFIGRHVAAALAKRGHSVVIGSRHPSRASRRLPTCLHGCERREIHLERLGSPEAWKPLLCGVDTVVNAVGILRERGAETYERVHHHAPAVLAAACARGAIRLVHVSALGLHAGTLSGFLTSKLAGERAIATCGSNYSIVRPSLLDGEGGYGAVWFRRVARWPVHFIPVEALGRMAPLDVRDLGEAIAVLCERGGEGRREVELGGSARRTMAEHLASMRALHDARPALHIPVPRFLARLGAHVCDLLHFSPFSFGHLELLRRDNVPQVNLLSALIGRTPTPVGARPGYAAIPTGHETPVPPSPQ